MSHESVLLILVRHGQAETNLRPDIIAGQSPTSPLTALGREEAVKCGRFLAASGVRPHSLSTSPLCRTRQTCSLLTAAYDGVIHTVRQTTGRDRGGVDSTPLTRDLCVMPPEVVDADLCEMSQGAWEGQPRSGKYTAAVRAAARADAINWAPPGGESKGGVTARMMRGLTRAADTACDAAGSTSATHPPHTSGISVARSAGPWGSGPVALVVTHGLAMRLVLREVLGGSWNSCHISSSIGNVSCMALRGRCPRPATPALSPSETTETTCPSVAPSAASAAGAAVQGSSLSPPAQAAGGSGRAWGWVLETVNYAPYLLPPPMALPVVLAPRRWLLGGGGDSVTPPTGGSDAAGGAPTPPPKDSASSDAAAWGFDFEGTDAVLSRE
eukprot:TRINITY_DN7796_c0_g1_i1.p1 TRINITY_DN7796_c0_g1~~TRINITY_DN7796_c0_g1_i1.p1  ORF type:complete len:384 (-),score=14.42 TRINITY_DN7796_c0_g1_i1:423-1574(-)